MSHSTLANDPSVSLTASCQTQDEFLKSRSPCMDQIGTPVMPRSVRHHTTTPTLWHFGARAVLAC